MKLPRQISGQTLASSLKIFGYQITRQTGSHIRLATSESGEHHITIPDHDFLRVGTFSSILKDVADHFKIEKEKVIFKLFG